MKKQIVLFSVLTLMFCLREAGAQTNKVAKFTSTTMPTGLTQSLIFDNGTNVGIGTGTITPTNKLEINGAANQLKLTAATAGQEASMLFSPGGTLNAWQTGINSTVNGWFLYENTAGAYRMVIQQGGRVGIGTTNPLSYSKLDVRGGALNVVNYATNGYGYIGRNADPGNNDSYLYHVISANYHIIGSSKNGTGAIKKLGFALGSTDTESDIKMTIDNNGNVGIGTTAPVYKLEVQAVTPTKAAYFQTSGSWQAIDFSSDGGTTKGSLSANGNKVFIGSASSGTNPFQTIDLSNGNVGIGTTTPSFRLDVAGVVAAGCARLDGTPSASNQYTRSNFGSNVYWNPTNSMWEVKAIGANDFSSIIHPNNDGIAFITAVSLANAPRSLTHSQFIAFERMRINANGNVLINKTSQTNSAYKLDVNGPVRANEVVVNTTGADFVFEENYELRKLEEVEKFIKENKHLPEIAPAEEMTHNGVGVGKLNTQLLQKIEELTLYLIEANKTIQKQNERITALEKSVEKK